MSDTGATREGRARWRAGLVAALLWVALPAGAADMVNGQKIYAQHCKVCHGDRGVPVMPQAPAFSRGERLMQPDLMLLTSIRAGRNAMPGFMGLLSDREILDVISFLRVLQ
jgi:cytochrome c6